MMPIRLARVAVLMLVTCLTTSCCFLQKQSLETEVETVASLRQGLEDEWAETLADLAMIESEVQDFTSNSVDWGAFDAQLVREAIRAAVDDKVASGAGGEEVLLTPVEELDAALETADEATRASAEATLATGSTLYQQLDHALNKGATRMTKQTKRAIRLGGESLLDAAWKVECSERSVFMNDEVKADLKQQHADLEVQVDELKALQATIQLELADYTQRVTTAMADFTAKLDEIGGTD